MPWPVWLTQEWWWLQFVLSYCPSDVSVKCVAWIWQDWSGELSRQMLYELGCYNFFFRKAVAFVVCFMHAKVGSHLGIFECPVFFVVFFLLCLCMHDIHNMHDHALCFSVDTSGAKLVCITFMKHACVHACLHACIINIMHVARGYLAQTCVVIWLILSRHHFWLPHGPTRMESRKEPCSIPSSRFPRTTRSNGVGYPVVV